MNEILTGVTAYEWTDAEHHARFWNLHFMIGNTCIIARLHEGDRASVARELRALAELVGGG